ncbi:MAG TPA: carboxypeptidase-like regulatory domain-containing protein [Longimicrobiales bacterium]|nr:carboxypeptidase-like regulatory domain-containing protein [Longimicrobiales bacterium]
MMLRPCFAISVSVACLFTAGSELAAQTLRVRLLDEQTGTAVKSAFVIVRDSAGRQVTSLLSDSAGRIQTLLPAGGTYSLRIERIGYRTFDVPAFVLQANTIVARDIAVPAAAIVLPSVDATTARRCSGPRELAAAAATIWEEARKALSVAAWTGRAGMITYQVREIQRDLDPDLQRVRQDSRDIRLPASRTPYRSVPARELAAEGYIRTQDGDWLYYAPDADVLLSDEFLDSHCFRAAVHAPSRDLIGLEFEPLAQRRDFHDISGVLWLDRNTYELRYLDFRYATLPFTAAVPHAGGRVYFQRLPDSGWIVDEWWIRMPMVRARLGAADGGQFVIGYHQTVREVISASRQGEPIPLRRR